MGMSLRVMGGMTTGAARALNSRLVGLGQRAIHGAPEARPSVSECQFDLDAGALCGGLVARDEQMAAVVGAAVAAHVGSSESRAQVVMKADWATVAALYAVTHFPAGVLVSLQERYLMVLEADDVTGEGGRVTLGEVARGTWRGLCAWWCGLLEAARPGAGTDPAA